MMLSCLESSCLELAVWWYGAWCMVYRVWWFGHWTARPTVHTPGMLSSFLNTLGLTGTASLTDGIRGPKVPHNASRASPSSPSHSKVEEVDPFLCLSGRDSLSTPPAQPTGIDQSDWCPRSKTQIQAPVRRWCQIEGTFWVWMLYWLPLDTTSEQDWLVVELDWCRTSSISEHSWLLVKLDELLRS